MEIFYKAIFISKILIIIPFVLIVFLINKKYKENEDRASFDETLESPIKRNKKPRIIRIRKR